MNYRLGGGQINLQLFLPWSIPVKERWSFSVQKTRLKIILSLLLYGLMMKSVDS